MLKAWAGSPGSLGIQIIIKYRRKGSKRGKLSLIDGHNKKRSNWQASQ